ncbi:MAG TPA: hypothetical protein VFX19_08205 [Dehalococcoidia bacterium]|nr:hypothetical protein [Dehalococcoidia bacterium]
MSSEFATRARLFREALSEALAGVDGAATGNGVVGELAALVERALPMAGEDETAAGALGALEAIARRGDVEGAVSEAAALFESPQRFREALYFARCLERDSGAALALVDARGYLAGASVPAHAFADLASKQATLLDQTTFSTLWHEPERWGWMVDEIAAWRRVYVALYGEAHTQYNDAIEALSGRVESLQGQASAVEKLNGLRRLGAPVADGALTRFREIEGLFRCSADTEQLGQMLAESPICGFCEFRPGEEAPSAEVERLADALARGLSEQRVRLGRRVGHLRAGGVALRDARLERLIQAVDGDDAGALDRALDEGMVQFLDDLLLTPEAELSLLGRLSQQFPEATETNLDDVIAEFRRLLSEEMARNGGRLHLAPEDSQA